MRRLWSDLGPIKTSQEMWMSSRSLSDCQSLTLNMSWFQFLNFSGIINCVTNIPISLSLSLSCLCVFLFSFFLSLSERSHVSTTALQCSEDDKIKTLVIHSLTDNFTHWAEAKKEHSAIRKVPIKFVIWAELRKVTEKSCTLAFLQKQQFFWLPLTKIRLCTWVVNLYCRFSIDKGHSLTHSLKWYYWNLK